MTQDDEKPPRGVRTMAVFRWILVAVMAVVAALSVTHSFGLVSSESASAEAAHYYCPMHPQVVQDHPGECPICSMTLVKKESSGKTTSPAPSTGSDKPSPEKAADAAPAAPERPVTAVGSAPGRAQGVPGLVPIELGFDRVQTIGVRTATATVEELSAELRTVGFVSADEARLARVHTRFSGWIEQLDAAVTGQKVSRGQVLASLYNLELLPAQQEFLASRRWNSGGVAGAPSAMGPAIGGELEKDARARLELFGMSPAEIERVAETGKPIRTVAVTAPIGGYVIAKSAVQGAYVQPDTQLFEIADLSKVWVLADIYEYELGRVSVGQVADVLMGAYPSERFTGKVGFIYPAVDASTRTLRVRIELDNKGMRLRPGMYGDVVIRQGGARGVVIPAEALVDTGEYQYVFVTKDGGRFEPRRVRAGPRAADKVQILEGLAPGEVVVTTANFMIDSESRLRAAIEGAPER